jgi:RhoGAP (GTPase activating protein)-like protein
MTAEGALKLFLRELPDPLFSHNLYDDFLAISDLGEEEQVCAM